MKFIFKDFPLESLHPQAFKAAEGTRCAAEQGKFWEMHDRLFENQRALGVEDLVKHAEALGLNAGKFKKCLDSSKYAQRIRDGMAVAQKAGARGTPYFAVGFAESNSTRVKIAKVIPGGAMPFASFKATLDSILASEKQ